MYSTDFIKNRKLFWARSLVNMKESIELARIRNEAAETVEQLEKQKKILTSLLQSIDCSVAKLSDNASGNAGMALSV